MVKKAAARSGKFKRSQTEAQEISQLEERIQQLQAEPAASTTGLSSFEDLPLSTYTLEGLRAAKYTQLTAIQRAALPSALAGRDVLGAAKTGSGKTLAFLIPVVERLYRLKWGRLDGLGALVVSPTRELALQIFDELRKVGARHDLSAGLLIGGKNVKQEQERVNGMNILVATPGRLLQHMDETPGFDASGLQALVLDEADRILDMGFSATLNAILENLPRRGGGGGGGRQTLLFSATQTRSVKDLARLSLRDPEYIAVHAEAAAPTPVKLQQAYVVCELPEKLNLLWAFIKSHLKAKVLVFLSTCKQVRFVHEAFRRLRPGAPLSAIHGKMKQMRRMAVFYDFCEARGGGVLFATDIAARGLDFPTVDWVLQVDCPEDVPAYIHRVGRTARYVAGGRSLLFLLPSERGPMLAQLEAAKVPLKTLKVNPGRSQPVGPALQALLSKNAELKELGQRALVSYMRSLFLQPNRAVFGDVAALPVAGFALSLGLSSAPQLRFLKRVKSGSGAAAAGAPAAAVRGDGELGVRALDDAEDVSSGSGGGGSQEGVRNAEAEMVAEVMQQRRDSGAAVGGSGRRAAQEGFREGVQDGRNAKFGNEGGLDAEEDFLVVKQRDVYEVAPDQAAAPAGSAAEPTKKAKKKRLKIKKGTASGTRVVFNEEGQALPPLAQLAVAGTFRDAPAEEQHMTSEERFRAARQELKQADIADRAAYRERRRQKLLAKKVRAKASAAEEGGGAGMQLAAAGEASGSEGDEGGAASKDSGSQGAGAYSGSDADAGGAYAGGLNESDSDGEAHARGRTRKRGDSRREPGGAAKRQRGIEEAPMLPEAAHLGMGTRGEADDRGRKALAGLSLAEQEALALSVLSRTRV